MTLPNWDALPVRTKRSRKRLYTLIASELSLTAWKSLPNNVKRSKIHLYNYIAKAKNLEEYDELAKNNMRSTRKLYTYIKANASGSKPTLTIKVKDGESNVSGATVTIGATEKTTDGSGECTFSLDYDNYTVLVEKSGYFDYEENIKFRANHKTFTIPLVAEPVTTGTVTVTCKDSTEENVSANPIILTTEPFNPSSPSLDIVVGMGYATSTTGVYTINEFTEQGQPTATVKDVPFGNYYLYASNHIKSISYTGTLTVDGDEEVTITLISGGK